MAIPQYLDPNADPYGYGQYGQSPYVQNYVPSPGFGAPPTPPAQGGTAQLGGQATQQVGQGLMSTGNPYAIAGGLLLQGVGTGLSAWGAYKASQQADKQYELAKKAYEEEKARTQKLDAINEQQRGISNDLQWGQYAGNLEDKGINTYGAYNRRIGR